MTLRRRALIVISATKRDLCELCAFAPLREQEVVRQVSRKGAKAQSLQKVAETMIRARRRIGAASGCERESR
jgi:hypothetical protein